MTLYVRISLSPGRIYDPVLTDSPTNLRWCYFSNVDRPRSLEDLVSTRKMDSKFEDLLSAIPWPRPIRTRPKMKTPTLCWGAKVCTKVAMTVMKQPIPIPALRPRASACSQTSVPDSRVIRIILTIGPPRNHPATIAPIE
jgi:hypothetical protein